MSFNRYYREELDYLRQLGRVFAEENPQLSRFLGDQGHDPDVERLLEGFAFLVGRLRQKVEDEFPELTHDLMSLIWPNFLRPVPAMSILEFTPVAGALDESTPIPRGCRVASQPVDGTACRFQTAYDVQLDPIKVTEAEAKGAGVGTQVTIKIRTLPGLTLQAMTSRRLRFYLYADPLVADAYYLWFLEHLKQVELRAPDGREAVARIAPSAVTPGGLSDTESLLPYPPEAFAGFRLFQEFFAFKEKYHFLDIGPLPLEQLGGEAQGFDLVFRFDPEFDDIMRPRANTFRLHCTPIVNIFPFDGDPIRVEQRAAEYRVRPSSRQSSHYEIFSVDQVEGWLQGSAERRLYRAFTSFEHDEEIQGKGRAIYYRTRLKPSAVARGIDHYLAFVDASDRIAMPPTETVSLKLSCTNRNLPEKLGIGDIDQPTSTSPDFAGFKNISRISEALQPPIEGRSAWTLVSNLSLNYRSLANVEALRVILAAYDFKAAVDRHAARKRKVQLEGIAAIRTEKVDRLYQGYPVRGVLSRLDMREANFGGPGSAYLFGTILSRFYALYASVNSFHQLQVYGLDQGETYTWPPMIGHKAIL
ncbi:MAG: type VI secretion system baseplate subunit TssF [Rhodothalassiaceae bacterium]